MSTVVDTSGLDRLRARFQRIANPNPIPLLATWMQIVDDDNRIGVLAGTDKDGAPLAPVTYRPLREIAGPQKAGARVALTIEQRLGQNPRLKRGRYAAFGSSAEGLYNNLSSSSYRKLDGPPLAPRRQFSRVITNLLTRFGLLRAAVWAVEGYWNDVVSQKGIPFLHFHFEGIGQKVRDLRGVRPPGIVKAAQALKAWTIDQIPEQRRVTDEVIRLILDLANSSKDVGELVERLERLKGATLTSADSYEVLDRKVGAFSLEASHVKSAMDRAVESAIEQTRAQKALNQVLEETAAVQAKAGGTSRDMQMRILNLGRAAQDLAQGGFGGIINNIEGIVGGGGIAAGVLTGIGTAALLATPYIKEWVKSLGSAGETFRPVVEGLERFTEAINKNKKEITDLKEKGELTYRELLRYKDLVAETTQLEEDQANARAARKVGAGSSKKERERAAAVQETIAEKFGSGQELIDTIMATEHGQQIGLKRVEEILADAQKGFGNAIQSLQNVSPQFREVYNQFSPESKAQIKAAQDALKHEQQTQARREKEIAARDKLSADLTKQGKQTEDAAAAKLEKEQAEGIRRGRQAGEAFERQSLRKPPAQPKLQQIPQGANEQDIAAITLANQATLNEMMKQDRAELRAMAKNVQRGIQQNRTQQTNGFPW